MINNLVDYKLYNSMMGRDVNLGMVTYQVYLVIQNQLNIKRTFKKVIYGS